VAFKHGSKAVIKLGTSAAPTTPSDISQYCTNVGNPRSADTADVTTLGKTSKEYIPGLKDGTLGLEGVFDPTVDAHLEGILAVEVGFEYGPQGSGTGSVKYTGKAILTSYEPDTSIDGAGTWSAELQITGDVTRGTYA